MPTLRPMSASFRAISIPCPRATSSDERHEARARSRPERTQLYVRFGDEGERRGAKSVGLALELDFYVDAGGQVELHQRVDGLRRGIHDVEQPLVRAHLELLARRLIDVRRA